MTRCLFVLAIVGFCAQPAVAQGLRDKINDLFIFGAGEDPLFLGGTAGSANANILAHQDHFIPSANESNGTLISFLQNAIAANVSNIPLGATSSGFTFRLVGGQLEATSTSPGPIFAERAQTLGRGRVLVAANVSAFSFKSLRGVQMDNLRLNFTHVNADFTGCDAQFGDDCTKVGVPQLENDVIELALDMDMQVTAVSFLLTFGLLDRVDIGVGIPVLFNSLRGTSVAQVVPFGGPTAAHFFGGTETSPELSASQFAEGSASGIGDIAARVKINLSESGTTGFAVLADARFATGSTSDFLGAGDAALRAMGIVSSTFGNFSPHANVGYFYRSGDLQNDAVLATVGFDHLLGSWVTLAVDFISALQVGESKLAISDDLVIVAPFRRVIDATTIPNVRDDILNGSLGFKFVTQAGLTIVTNSIWPLNSGGVRPNVMWTAGLEYNF